MKTTASGDITDWRKLHDTPALQTLAIKRRATSIRLFILCLLLFFSVPFLASSFPQLMQIRLTDSLNLGLIWTVLQFPIGGLIAWRYATRMREIDEAVTRLSSNH